MNRRTRDLERLLAMIALQNEARLVEIRKTNGGHMKGSFEEGAPISIAIRELGGRFQRLHGCWHQE